MSFDLPSVFKERLRKQFGKEAREIIHSYGVESPVSIRLNPFKPKCSYELAESIPWTAHGYYIDRRPSFTLDPYFHAGCYYVQEASSMILEQVFEQYSPKRVLDLCAAPGGKSTLLASTLQEDAILLSNEIVPKRFKILEENVIKWGRLNHLITCASPKKLEALGPIFDLILVDAPCSGEGLFRKQPEAVKEWNEENLQRCSMRQRDILRSASKLLSSGGTIVYSTCTLNPAENEHLCDWAVRDLDLTSVTSLLDIDADLFQVNTDLSSSFLCLPNRMRGEPFFFSILQKQATQVIGSMKIAPKSFGQAKTPEVMDRPSGLYQDHRLEDVLVRCSTKALDMVAHGKKQGLRLRLPDMGTFKRDKFIPSHFAAMSLSHDPQKSIELSVDQSLDYLRLNFNLNFGLTPGWHTVCRSGIPLGWIKVIRDGRINNYYPKSYRIRNL